MIGIDPDDREFAIAKAKGLRDHQLIKLTLQEYQSTFPDQKFDLATVFLWNISFDERESFAEALAAIIKPGGCIIIGYADNQYHRGQASVPELMVRTFHQIEFFFHGPGHNEYLLKCSEPRKR